MNKTVQLVLLTMLVISASFSQTPEAGTQRKVEVRGEGDVAEAIIAREEGFWDAWKNRQADFFKQNLTEESVVIVGTHGKENRRFWRRSRRPIALYENIPWRTSRRSP